MCVAQPTVWFECERKLRTGHRADTRQICVLLVPCLLNEWSSLANLWTSGARRLLSERVWNSLVVVTRSHVWKTACDCLGAVEVLLLLSALDSAERVVSLSTSQLYPVVKTFCILDCGDDV